MGRLVKKQAEAIGAIRCATLAVVLAAASGCQSLPRSAGTGGADLIFTNARVYTVEPGQPWAQAVAIKDGKILAVGGADEIARRGGSNTRVVDLGGRLLMPSFGDMHVHPIFGGLAYSRCSLHAGQSLRDYQAIISKCIANSPGNGPLYGVGWEDSLFPPNGIPRKEVLDQVSRDRPLIFESVGGHTYWLNSKALEVAGITKNTPNPPNGVIDRDPATGEAVGGLQESAMDLAKSLIPVPTPAEMQESILYTAKLFNSLGITNWHDAGIEVLPDGSSPTFEAYKAVHDRGQLTTNVTLALKWANDRSLDQLPVLLSLSQRARLAGLSANSIKFYVDGVIPQKTALMLAPYENSGRERGKPQIPVDVLNQAVAEVEARGLQAHIHAIGDGAVRIALDSYEAARARNGVKDGRHLISHLNVVDPADQPRFGKLGAIAQFQPTWSSWYPYMELTETAIGAGRMAYIYPSGGIHRSGGILAYGADWPVATANPFEGLEVAVTRRTAGDANAKPLLPHEGITLAEAVKAHTLNVAYASHLERQTGSIAPGKSADLIVVDRDIFAVPITDVSKAKVLMTMFKGKPVFGEIDQIGR